MSYRPDIDGLWAVAVLLVLIFHFTLVPGGKAGFLGVDVFFVISGLLITSILKKQLDNGTFSLSAFYVNRIRRLAPALFTVLIAMMAICAWWLFPSELEELSKQILVSQLYVSNIYYWRSINYFGLTVHDVYLLHTWSLAVEEQFYLLYPACLMLVHRHLRKYFWAALAVALIISFGLNVYWVIRKPEATFYLLPTRAWELLTGAMIPLAASTWKPSRFANESVGLLGAALIALSVVHYHVDVHFPGYFALLPVLGAACLLLSGQYGPTLCSHLLSSRVLVYIGRISYSLYLVHWPVNVFASQLIDNYTLGWRVGMFALSVLLAAVINYLVEEPYRRRFVAKTTNKLLTVYGAGLLATLAWFAAVQISHGLPQRFPAEVSRLASYVNDKSPPLEECEFKSQLLTSPNEFCHIGALEKKPIWLVYGDSHAWAIYAALDGWLKANHQSGLFIYRHACAPLAGYHLIEHDDGCFKFNESVSHFIEGHRDIPNLLLVSTWKWPLNGGLVDPSIGLLDDDAGVRLFTNCFSITLKSLHAVGHNVYIWEPVPGGRANVPVGLARALWEHKASQLEHTFAEYLSDNKPFFDALRANRDSIAASFSPSRLLCSTGNCIVQLDGVPLYYDNAHPTNSSAHLWTQVLQNGLPIN